MEKILSFNEEENHKNLDRLEKEQPVLVEYMALVSREMDEEEGLFLFHSGMCIWLIMSEGKLSLPRVTVERLEAVRTKNEQMLDRIEKLRPSKQAGEFEKIFAEHPQSELVAFLLELLSDFEDDKEIDPEQSGTILMELLTIIDCLDSR